MLTTWVKICLTLNGVSATVITFVFSFWFVYLLVSIKQKWNCYRTAMGCVQVEKACFNDQIDVIAYNSKTEFVKSIYLFIMNILEWLTFVIICIVSMAHFALIIYKTQPAHNPKQLLTALEFDSSECLITNLLLLGNNCLVLCLVVFASLCNYLAARYARVRWIDSTRIPGFICIFVLYSVVNQVIAASRTITIVALWFNTLLLTLSLIMAITQYRKLNMVLKWTIVDLQISQNNSRLLAKNIQMKRAFSRTVRVFILGLILSTVTDYTTNIMLSAKLIFSDYDYSRYQNLELIFSKILFVFRYTVSFIGAVLVFTPYVGYGVLTLYKILWRLVTGKTGYKTHFRNELFNK